MPETRIDTPNYAFDMPNVGGSKDTWGDSLNSNWAALDTILQTMQAQIDANTVRVGGVYLTTEVFDDAAAVAAALGYGEWEAHAEGRALVGVGTSNTSSAWAWAVNQERGAEEIILATSQLPAHSHNVGSIAASIGNAGANGSYFELGSNEDNNLVIATSGSFSQSNSGQNARFATTDSGTKTKERVTFNWLHSHSATMSGSSANAGSGVAHSNTQPSIGIYVWKRTA